MAVGKAAGVGAVAALAIPYILHDDHDAFGGWVHRGVVHFDVASFHFSWSWPIFCIVTLFAWACFAVIER
jgi:hypothetical protein